MSLFKRKMKMSPPPGFWGNFCLVLSQSQDLSRNYQSGGRNTYGGDNFESGRDYKIPGDKGLIG